MTYTIYKSSDTDAPQLTNAAGSLKTILKACLITGYGTGADAKAPAGWLMPFEEPNKAVFQPVDAGGENLYIKIDATNSTYPSFFMYKEMTNINTGTEQVNGYKPRINSGEWFVIATAAWFWLFVRYTVKEEYYCYFCGNIPKIMAENRNKTIMGGTNGVSCFAYIYAFKSSAGIADMLRSRHATYGHLKHADDELIWLDILLADEKSVLGKLPLLKWCPKNNGLTSWQEISNNAFALQMRNGNYPVQLVMDFNDVS